MIEIGVIIAVIVGLGELYKQLELPTKFLPLLNLVFGILGSIAFLSGSIAELVFYGLALGLSASGLFDQTKLFKK